jgi:hypothetical protein
MMIQGYESIIKSESYIEGYLNAKGISTRNSNLDWLPFTQIISEIQEWYKGQFDEDKKNMIAVILGDSRTVVKQ